MILLPSRLLPLALAGAVLGQDPPSPPAGDPPVPEEWRAEAPGSASEADLPPRGVLPEGTAPEAVEVWERLVTAAGPSELAPGEEPSFAVSFDVLVRDGVRTNETTVTHRYLAPGFVKSSLSSGREQGLGPSGYWLRDGDELVSLAGREHAEDRRQIDRALAISRNFLSLVRPGSLRLTALAVAGGPPARYPIDPAVSSHAERFAALDWLELSSPDFDLATAAEPTDGPRSFHVDLGVDGEGRPVYAAIAAERGGESVPASALFVWLRDHEIVDGHRVPRTVWIYEVASPEPPFAFERRPSQELYLEGADLRPALAREDFDPSAAAPGSNGSAPAGRR